MKRNSVRTTLFISYFIPILLTITLLSVTSFLYTSRVLRSVEESNLAEITDKMVSIIDSEVKNMNNISLNITSSNLLKKNIAALNNLLQQGYDLKSTEIYLAARSIESMFAMIAGPIKAVPQINLIIPGEFLIGSGTYVHINQIPEVTSAAVENIDDNYGKRHFSGPSRDRLAETAFPRYSNQQYISLYRTVFDEQNKNSIGIIEVKQFAETIFYGPSKAPRHFMIFDSNYNQLFPPTVEESGTYTEILKNHPLIGLTAFTNPVTGENEIISIGKCREIDWTILNITLESNIMSPVYRFLLIIILSALLMFFISISIAKRLSVMITESLSQLRGWIKNLHWDKISVSTPSEIEVMTPLVEFEDIHQEFWKVHKKLHNTMKLVVRERSLQENARMLALQAQMDPHFIYNMLTTISIMAEDGENGFIVETINRLTSILRYTASRSKLYVALSEELKITEQYLQCMKIRFGENLTYSLKVEAGLETLEVPKLIILPLIENSMKYAINGEPPWKIEINGCIRNSEWILKIEDNGPGFNQEAQDKINALLRQCDERAENQLNFHFDGLGIPNIYSRLKILFSEEVEFRVMNSCRGGAGSGACISIRGPYDG